MNSAVLVEKLPFLEINHRTRQQVSQLWALLHTYICIHILSLRAELNVLWHYCEVGHRRTMLESDCL